MKRLVSVLLAVVVAAAGLALSSSPAAAQGLSADVEARDTLIAAQENLLNAYRCLNGTDTEAVAGGVRRHQPG